MNMNMNGNLVRTTITLPADLYEKLREQAFYQRTSFSALIREGCSQNLKQKDKKAGSGIAALADLGKFVGKLSLKGNKGVKWQDFDRAKFYDKALKRKMSFGY